MDRKEFLSQVGLGAASVLIPICMGGLSGCKKIGVTPNTDFIIDISTGALAKNGGFLVSNGVLIARTNSGTFIAVSAACTHQGTNVNYNASGNNFICPNHGARFDSNGNVIQGPASASLTKFNSTLSGSSLHVFA